jgi:hypothetical protein
MLSVLPRLFFPLCREYLVAVLRARVGTWPSCLMGEAVHAGKKDQIYQSYSMIQMAHTRDPTTTNASVGNSLSTRVIHPEYSFKGTLMLEVRPQTCSVNHYAV